MTFEETKAMRLVKNIVVPALLLASVALPVATRASELGQFNMTERLRLTQDETHIGDVYVLAEETRVDGALDGDLIAWTANLQVDGEVTGDTIIGAQHFHLTGVAQDTVRAFAQSVIIDGRIEGDLVVFSAMLRIGDGAHITGNLIACSATVTMDGTVDGELMLTGGELDIDGTVGDDARVEVDAVRLGPEARLLGDFTYSSRRDLEMDEGATIAGETIIREKPKKTEKDDDGWSFFSVAWWFWSTLSAMVVGLVLVALFRRAVPAVTGAIGGEPMIGALIGFGAFLVVPAASLLAILLIISLPLGVVSLVLFLVALYVAKMPVAVWLGDRLLSLLGSSAPSPYLAIVIGLLLLQLVFTVPYLGTLAKLAAIWLGLGAMILATRSHFRQDHTTSPAPQ
jgi:cytoskeletal protein CcmA (bactofilin family)